MRLATTAITKRATVLTLSTVLIACGGSSSNNEEPIEPVGNGNTTEGGGGTAIGASTVGVIADSSLPCEAGRGVDNDSADSDWSNNCVMERDGSFAESRYTDGIQRIVWCQGHAELTESLDDFNDADFGPSTEAAVRTFQSSLNISADGIVGAETWAALQDTLVTYEDTANYTLMSIIGGITVADCDNLPAFYQYKFPDQQVKAWTMTDTLGDFEEVLFGNTFFKARD